MTATPLLGSQVDGRTVTVTPHLLFGARITARESIADLPEPWRTVVDLAHEAVAVAHRERANDVALAALAAALADVAAGGSVEPPLGYHARVELPDGDRSPGWKVLQRLIADHRRRR